VEQQLEEKSYWLELASGFGREAVNGVKISVSLVSAGKAGELIVVITYPKKFTTVREYLFNFRACRVSCKFKNFNLQLGLKYKLKITSVKLCKCTSTKVLDGNSLLPIG
jgi:hypothetical protein